MPTDLHCHLLPGIDDGPSHVDASLGLARALVASGVDRVVATPHVNRRFPTTPEQIVTAVAILREALATAGVALEVASGAEVAASQLPDLDATRLSALSLGPGPWLLLEPPLTTDFAFERAVDQVLGAGLRPLVAHPERCRLFQSAPERLPALVAQGAALSVTASSLTGAFGRDAQELAWRLVDAGLVSNVSSDAHDVVRRPPNLLADLAAAGLSESCEAWCETFPAAVLGEPATAPPRHSAAPAHETDEHRVEERSPDAMASSMLADGADQGDVERFLLARLPPVIAERHLRRLLREQATR